MTDLEERISGRLRQISSRIDSGAAWDDLCGSLIHAFEDRRRSDTNDAIIDTLKGILQQLQSA